MARNQPRGVSACVNMEPDLAHRCGSLMAEHEKDGSKSREAQEKARRREAKQAAPERGVACESPPAEAVRRPK